MFSEGQIASSGFLKKVEELQSGSSSTSLNVTREAGITK